MKRQSQFIQLLSGVIIFISVVVIIFLNGCSKSASSGSGGTNNPGNSMVTIQNFSFTSSDLHITKGTTVVWTNNDNVTHTVTADDGSFTSGNIAPGANYSKAFTAAGTIHYHCTIHPYMTADVVVK